jgi:hypothetical protein
MELKRITVLGQSRQKVLKNPSQSIKLGHGGNQPVIPAM